MANGSTWSLVDMQPSLDNGPKSPIALALAADASTLVH